MRASSLSNKEVIELLNACFVPVHIDGTFVKSNAQADPKQMEGYQAIFREMHKANLERKSAGQTELSTGTVHAYVFAADGQAIDSRHVAHAGPTSVIKMLEDAVETLDVAAGEPIVAPSCQSPRPETSGDEVVLHLTARYLVPRNSKEARKDVDGDELVPRDATRLGTERSGGWSALPSEDWFVLDRNQWTKLLPAERVKVGESWQIDADLAKTLLTRFYPTTEENDLTTNRIDEQVLRMTVLSIDGDKVRARIDGKLKMKHTFYPNRDDDNFVNAEIIGLIEFDAAEKKILALQIVTDNATYGESQRRQQPFGVALKM